MYLNMYCEIIFHESNLYYVQLSPCIVVAGYSNYVHSFAVYTNFAINFEYTMQKEK